MPGKFQFTVDTSALHLQNNKKWIQLENYTHGKTSRRVNTHTFSFNRAKNTGPDTVDWTLTPPAEERILRVRPVKIPICIKTTLAQHMKHSSKLFLHNWNSCGI